MRRKRRSLIGIMMACGLSLSACGSDVDPLVGTWEVQDADDSEVLTIRDDGTFGMQTGDADCTGTVQHKGDVYRVDADCGIATATGDGTLSGDGQRFAVRWTGQQGVVVYTKVR